jgi:hypothetical protein
MSVLAKTYFHNEKAAFLHLEKLLWKGGVVCPHCGTVDHASRLEGVKGKPTQTKAAKVRLGLWKGGWPRMFAFLKHWRDRRGQALADADALMAKYWS